MEAVKVSSQHMYQSRVTFLSALSCFSNGLIPPNICKKMALLFMKYMYKNSVICLECGRKKFFMENILSYYGVDLLESHMSDMNTGLF